MPWEVRKDGDRYCVYKEGSDEPLKCYDDQNEADDYAAALYANADDDMKKGDIVFFPPFSTFKCYKSADGTEGVVEAPGILFDDEARIKDLDNQYFTTKTYYGKREGDGVDATFNHRFPVRTKDTQANELLKGVAKHRFKNAVSSFKDNAALIGRHVLDLRDDFEKWVYEMCEKGAMSWSTGTASHMADWDRKTGEITDWPIIEWAYTPTPAQPLNPRITPIKSIKDVIYDNFSLEINSENPIYWYDFHAGPDVVSVTIPRDGNLEIWVRVDGEEEEEIEDETEENSEDNKVIHPATKQENADSNDDKGAENARLRQKRVDIKRDQTKLQRFQLELLGEN